MASEANKSRQPTSRLRRAVAALGVRLAGYGHPPFIGKPGALIESFFDLPAAVAPAIPKRVCAVPVDRRFDRAAHAISPEHEKPNKSPEPTLGAAGLLASISGVRIHNRAVAHIAHASHTIAPISARKMTLPAISKWDSRFIGLLLLVSLNYVPCRADHSRIRQSRNP